MTEMKNTENDHRIIEFLMARTLEGAAVFDEKMSLVYCNRSAELFFDRLSFPDEVDDICKRMFGAFMTGKFKEQFPGEVNIYKKLENSPGKWTFRLHLYESGPLICVFIHEEALSEKINLNETRRQFRLTRRETDVIRRVINGLSNDDIAKEFEISEQTIKDHLSNAYHKFGVRNRVELVSFLFNAQLPA
jgi:DNA-binding CsgD family transcriptional regulator